MLYYAHVRDACVRDQSEGPYLRWQREGTEELEQKIAFILWQTSRKSKVKKHSNNPKSGMFGNIEGQKVIRVQKSLSWRPEEDPRRKRHAGASMATPDTGESRAQFSPAAPW